MYPRIFKVFPQYSEAVQKIVLAHIGGLIRALSTSPAKLLSLIRSFPPDCDALILRIYLILADRKPISPELVETAKEVYRNKELDARFIIPVLSALSKV